MTHDEFKALKEGDRVKSGEEGSMSAPIPKDLRYDYEFAQRCGNDRLVVSGYFAVQLIERIAALEAQVAALSKPVSREELEAIRTA